MKFIEFPYTFAMILVRISSIDIFFSSNITQVFPSQAPCPFLNKVARRAWRQSHRSLSSCGCRFGHFGWLWRIFAEFFINYLAINYWKNYPSTSLGEFPRIVDLAINIQQLLVHLRWRSHEITIASSLVTFRFWRFLKNNVSGFNALQILWVWVQTSQNIQVYRYSNLTSQKKTCEPTGKHTIFIVLAVDSSCTSKWLVTWGISVPAFQSAHPQTLRPKTWRAGQGILWVARGWRGHVFLPMIWDVDAGVFQSEMTPLAVEIWQNLLSLILPSGDLT